MPLKAPASSLNLARWPHGWRALFFGYQPPSFMVKGMPARYPRAVPAPQFPSRVPSPVRSSLHMNHIVPPGPYIPAYLNRPVHLMPRFDVISTRPDIP